MDASGAQETPLDVVSVGELVVDFISVEQTDTLGNATTYREEAWEVLAEVLPYVTIVKPSLEDARRLFDPNLDDDALEDACLGSFHDLGADVVVMTRSGGGVTVSDSTSVERVGPLPRVRIENVTGARDAFWSALLIARLDGKEWQECVRFAHEVATLKLGAEGHVERMIDRQALYDRLESPAEHRA